MNTIRKRIQDMSLQLPAAPAPVAAYVPAMRSGHLIFISGQLPFVQGKLPPQYTGRVPTDVSLDSAQSAARQCVLNGLAVLDATLADSGGLDAIQQVVRLGIFVQCDPDFTDQPKVANGASELIQEIFASQEAPDRGRHARAAVGSIALPLGSCIEIEMIASINDQA